MAPAEDPETEAWLSLARQGDESAVRWLLERHRVRLRRMIGLRLDDRVASRLDASDIVQETLIDAVKKLDGYLRERPLPFFPWLYGLAIDRLAQAHRHHLRTLRRRADLELAGDPRDAAASRLVDLLAESGTSPSGRLSREEDCAAIRRALAELSVRDRELLVMRYVDQLTFVEIAALLGLSDGAVRLRHLRALQRIGPLLGASNRGTRA
ncbi:MAG: sigma-70 family RNA polymerase sigma factor [Isosphaeraceae bacterium]|nr:sigma-70 family RNA polymerase sigma factor [Isosphaeraceae bacterium]